MYFRPTVCVLSQQQCRMVESQLWFLLKICLHHQLLQAQPKFLRGKSEASDTLKRFIHMMPLFHFK